LEPSLDAPRVTIRFVQAQALPQANIAIAMEIIVLFMVMSFSPKGNPCNHFYKYSQKSPSAGQVCIFCSYLAGYKIAKQCYSNIYKFYIGQVGHLFADLAG
jgi:hypothetical protein